MSNSKIDLDIEIDVEECVPTVRFNPLAYHTKMEQQVYDEFWSRLEPLPITKRARPITTRAKVSKW